MAVLEAAPVGTAYDMTVNPPKLVPPTFNINKSGGMEKADMVKYVTRDRRALNRWDADQPRHVLSAWTALGSITASTW